VPEEDLVAKLKEMDADGDGEVSFKEHSPDDAAKEERAAEALNPKQEAVHTPSQKPLFLRGVL
jgi:hypothetical protein